MARCFYCDKSAGLFRKFHQSCRERHDYALGRIPDFFPKFFASDLPVDRFGQLLQEGAEASHLTEQELRDAVTSGFLKIIDSILEERLLALHESARILHMIDGLAPILSDNNAPYEKLAKVDTLIELQNGRTPDLIDVQDMPIEMRRGETIMWIFNDATAYQAREEAAPVPDGGITVPLDSNQYHGLSAFNGTPLPREELQEQSSGDLVVTNRNLYFVVSESLFSRIPIVRLGALRGYADGILLLWEGADNRARAFVLNDAWFAANLVANLFHASSSTGRHSRMP